MSAEVDSALEVFDTQRAGRVLSTFIDELSNWYVRRNRRRFWDGDPAALATLHEALRILTLCLAPFTPFITERVWQDLIRTTDADAPTSVHLASWPEVDRLLLDDGLVEQMALVRRIVELGRGARGTAKVRTRQPLGRALVAAPRWAELPDELRALVADELNVGAIDSLAGEDLVDVTVKPNFRTLGRRFGGQTQAVAAQIARGGAELASRLRSDGSATVDVADVGVVELTADDLIVTETPREGWAVASEGGESVALDLAIDEDLKLAGLARELVRTIQEGRKTAGLDVTDRITVMWSGDDEIAATFARHADDIAREVLAVAMSNGDAADAATVVADEDGLRLAIARA
jgi:isoleucyl-tRNA synthetase